MPCKTSGLRSLKICTSSTLDSAGLDSRWLRAVLVNPNEVRQPSSHTRLLQWRCGQSSALGLTPTAQPLLWITCQWAEEEVGARNLRHLGSFKAQGETEPFLKDLFHLQEYIYIKKTYVFYIFLCSFRELRPVFQTVGFLSVATGAQTDILWKVMRGKKQSWATDSAHRRPDLIHLSSFTSNFWRLRGSFPPSLPVLATCARSPQLR